jgi:hypothetical protein
MAGSLRLRGSFRQAVECLIANLLEEAALNGDGRLDAGLVWSR